MKLLLSKKKTNVTFIFSSLCGDSSYAAIIKAGWRRDHHQFCREATEKGGKVGRTDCFSLQYMYTVLCKRKNSGIMWWYNKRLHWCTVCFGVRLKSWISMWMQTSHTPVRILPEPRHSFPRDGLWFFFLLLLLSNEQKLKPEPSRIQFFALNTGYRSFNHICKM